MIENIIKIYKIAIPSFIIFSSSIIIEKIIYYPENTFNILYFYIKFFFSPFYFFFFFVCDFIFGNKTIGDVIFFFSCILLPYIILLIIFILFSYWLWWRDKSIIGAWVLSLCGYIPDMENKYKDGLHDWILGICLLTVIFIFIAFINEILIKSGCYMQIRKILQKNLFYLRQFR